MVKASGTGVEHQGFESWPGGPWRLSFGKTLKPNFILVGLVSATVTRCCSRKNANRILCETIIPGAVGKRFIIHKCVFPASDTVHAAYTCGVKHILQLRVYRKIGGSVFTILVCSLCFILMFLGLDSRGMKLSFNQTLGSLPVHYQMKRSVCLCIRVKFSQISPENTRSR